MFSSLATRYACGFRVPQNAHATDCRHSRCPILLFLVSFSVSRPMGKSPRNRPSSLRVMNLSRIWVFSLASLPRNMSFARWSGLPSSSLELRTNSRHHHVLILASQHDSMGKLLCSGIQRLAWFNMLNGDVKNQL